MADIAIPIHSLPLLTPQIQKAVAERLPYMADSYPETESSSTVIGIGCSITLNEDDDAAEMAQDTKVWKHSHKTGDVRFENMHGADFETQMALGGLSFAALSRQEVQDMVRNIFAEMIEGMDVPGGGEIFCVRDGFILTSDHPAADMVFDARGKGVSKITQEIAPSHIRFVCNQATSNHDRVRFKHAADRMLRQIVSQTLAERNAKKWAPWFEDLEFHAEFVKD